MRIIPVLDLKSGLAVAGCSGQRDRYGLLGGSPEGCNPLAWARRFRDQLRHAGFPERPVLYVADLDAIEGQFPHLELYSSLAAQEVLPWVDAGIRSADDAPPMLAAGVDTLIVGLETATGPEVLSTIVAEAGAERVCFSLDLRDGRPMIDTVPVWGTNDPLLLAQIAVDCGVHRLIVLDLDRIGTGRGIGTESLLQSIREHSPSDLTLIAGGGLAGREQLDRLGQLGVDAALVGSALRDGRLGLADLQDLASNAPPFPRPTRARHQRH